MLGEARKKVSLSPTPIGGRLNLAGVNPPQYSGVFTDLTTLSVTLETDLYFRCIEHLKEKLP
jgi:hypothetical protein